jgi:hypothetical protein
MNRVAACVKAALTASICAGLLCIVPSVIKAVGPTINLNPFATSFNNPIGIDFFEPNVGTGQLLATAFYPTGNPVNFELIDAAGTHTAFTTQSHLPDELKVATVRGSTCTGGFVVGTAFAGNGTPGQIMKINPNGSVVNPWAVLSGEGIDIRGSLYQDRACAFNGDLIVVTGNEQNGTASNDRAGNLWRVNNLGVATKVATINRHLEGVITLPGDAAGVAKYGPLAGTAVIGDEDLIGPFFNSYGPNGRIWAVTPTGAKFTVGAPFDISTPNYATSVPLHPEDLDLIPRPRTGVSGPEGDLFAVDFGHSQILRAPAADFADKCGQILVTQEFPTTGATGVPSGFSTLTWNSIQNQFAVTPLANTGTASVGHYEHVTFWGGGECAVPPPPGPSHGCTPGFWKTHATNPPWGSYSPSQSVGSVFTIPNGIPSHTDFAAESLLTALDGGGGKGLDGKTTILLRAAVAALLNADNGNPAYPISAAQVISQTNAALASLNETSITNLATQLDTWNNQCDVR